MKWWSPYLVGACIGVLSWFTFLTADKPIGITSAFEHTAALAGRAVVPAAAAEHGYYSSPEHRPRIGWEWMFVVGVFFGSLTSAWLSGDRAATVVPEIWEKPLRPESNVRLGGAVIGATLMMFGARLANGCTSGTPSRHAATGAVELDLRGG